MAYNNKKLNINKNKTLTSLNILSILYALIGIYFCIRSIPALFNLINISLYPGHSIGTIHTIDEKFTTSGPKGGSGGFDQILSVKFTTETGQSVNATYRSWDRKYPVGSNITILYNKKNPNISTIRPLQNDIFLNSILLTFGILLSTSLLVFIKKK